MGKFKSRKQKQECSKSDSEEVDEVEEVESKSKSKPLPDELKLEPLESIKEVIKPEEDKPLLGNSKDSVPSKKRSLKKAANQFQCVFCFHTCSSRSKLKLHLAIHTPIKCNCKRHQPKKGELPRYVRGRPLNCNLCKYKTTARKYFLRHARTHLQNDPRIGYIFI